MKEFEAPKVEVVRFAKSDVITDSSCLCVDCTVCPDGKNTCACYEFANESIVEG